jgi:hypothetical protein
MKHFSGGKPVREPNLNVTGDPQAHYWLGPLSRREAQKIFDEYGATIQRQAQALIQQDLCIAYLCEKFGITPDDVLQWAQKKAEQAKVEQPAENPAPSLITADA